MKNKFLLEKYIPFEEINNFYILHEQFKNEKYLLYSSADINYSLKIKENGYIPKSGLIFSDILRKEVKNKKILDLCTGQLGILAIHSAMFGAKYVKAVDIDEECVNWFHQILVENEIKNIEVLKSNLYEKIPIEKFDMILSNPPQMPMINGKTHDSGGLDGREYLIKILNTSIDYLNANGELYLLVFDFLGTFTKTNEEKALIQLAKEIGYSKIEIVCEVKKIIKKNSVTYNSLEYIKKVYPKYKFRKYKNNLYFNIQIIKFKKEN